MEFAEFQESEAHTEGLIEVDHDLVEIETQDVNFVDEDTLAFWCA